MLETRDLLKRYQAGREAVHAVDGVSLRVAAGEFVALYGPSGSGKSTLIDLIAGFQAPDAGTVLVDGRDIATFSEREHADYLLRVLGIVGQPTELMPAARARERRTEAPAHRPAQRHAPDRAAVGRARPRSAHGPAD